MSKASETEKAQRDHDSYMHALGGTLHVLNGKWKLHIIGSLTFGKKRFKEIERHITGITPRMLSKELKDLEAAGIVERTVHKTV